ncbi:MAG: hypothetical protein JWN37_693 [Candidatus Nomurabacteria bacterium]|nr:hypothetical protein [Candidatus Nomurabacteria bacterium]
MKRQVLVIHGGEVFSTYEEYLESLMAFEPTLDMFVKVGWKKRMQEGLGDS